MVSIIALQAVVPGSIPGQRMVLVLSAWGRQLYMFDDKVFIMVMLLTWNASFMVQKQFKI